MAISSSKDLYPHGFPDTARNAVEAERIKAKREFDRNKAIRPRSYGSLSAEIEPLLFKYVLRVFLVFATETCTLGWTIDKVRAKCDIFLCRFTLAARNESASIIETHFSTIDGEFLTARAERKLKRSNEWKTFEDLLLKMANSQRKTHQAAIRALPDSKSEKQNQTHSVGAPVGGVIIPTEPAIAQETLKQRDYVAKVARQAPPDKGKGRDPKATTQKLRQEYGSLGSPELTSTVLDALASSVFPGELAKAKKGGLPHKRLRDRIRVAIKREP